MALFEYEVDDTFIGKTLTPENGFLVDCKQVRPASHYVAPYGYNGVWVTGYFQIRGAFDQRDLICVCPAQSPAWPGYVVGRSIFYQGGLRILCVPKGSLWRMTLSDVALSQRELRERGEGLQRKQLEEAIIAMRKDYDLKHPRRSADDGQPPMEPIEPQPVPIERV